MKRFTRIAPIAAIVGLLIVLTGCATIFAGKQTNVKFSADPEGAQVFVNGSLMGTTPLRIRLDNNKDYTIEFRAEGYQPRTVFLSKNVGAGWVILDVVMGLVPVLIDAVTGDWYFLNSDNVRVLLDEK